MCIYIYIYIHIYTYTYTHMCVCIYVSMYLCMNPCIYIYIYPCMYYPCMYPCMYPCNICRHVYAGMYACTYTWSCFSYENDIHNLHQMTCISIYIHIIYIYIHMCIHIGYLCKLMQIWFISIHISKVYLIHIDPVVATAPQRITSAFSPCCPVAKSCPAWETSESRPSGLIVI